MAVQKWVDKTEERKKDNPNGDFQDIKVHVTVMEKEILVLHQLLQETNSLLKGKFCRHVFNISHKSSIHSTKRNESYV